MAIPTYTSAGAKAATEAKLSKEIFAVEVTNHQLLKDVYVAHMANGRENLAKTLKRGQVSGGGIKPWRQKGTGRARTGSIRNPIWRGGGIVFGPSGNENYSKKVNQKAAKQALRQALSLATADGRISVIDNFVVKDGKTKTAAKLLAKINTPSRVVIVVDNISSEVARSVANLPDVNILSYRSLSTYDVLSTANIVFTTEAIKGIEARLGDKK